MKRLTPDSPELKSADLVVENIERLRELFPEAFANEGKIDFDVLRQLLGDRVDGGEERYGLNWHGKRAARQLALTPSTGTLRPCPEESVDWDTTQNIFIEGDNLEVLKLLQKSYAGKVKLIYIDPPYNTGKDFVYPDNFQDSIKNYLEITGQVEGGQRITSNTEASGRFHTDWLNMMYPRLKCSKTLLAPDGLLVAQIGDTEVANLQRILDEIFGEDSFLNCVTVKAKVAAGASGGGEDKRLKKNVEYLLVYANNASEIGGFTHCFVETPLLNVIKEMQEAGQSWKYTNVLVSEGSRQPLATTVDGDGNKIAIYLHEGVERCSLRDICRKEGLSEQEAYVRYLDRLFSDTNAQTSIRTRVIDATGPLRDGQMYSVEYTPTSGREKGQHVRHYYISPTVRRVIWLKDVAYFDGTQVIKRERTGTLWDDISYNNIGKEGGVPFPNGKKPLALLQRVLGLLADKDAIVLDFFAGSGTTSHAAVLQNQADGGTRRCIAVQLPQEIPDDDDNAAIRGILQDAGLQLTVAEITKERLRRVARQTADGGELCKQDSGFRVFKLDSGNVRPWEASKETLAASLAVAVDHVKPDRTEDDLLYDLILKHGLDLCAAIDEKQIGGHKVRSVGGGAVFACFGSRITAADVEQLADGIAKWRDELAPASPELSRVVLRDSAFETDVAKTNLALILKERGFDEKLVVSL